MRNERWTLVRACVFDSIFRFVSFWIRLMSSDDQRPCHYVHRINNNNNRSTDDNKWRVKEMSFQIHFHSVVFVWRLCVPCACACDVCCFVFAIPLSLPTPTATTAFRLDCLSTLLRISLGLWPRRPRDQSENVWFEFCFFFQVFSNTFLPWTNEIRFHLHTHNDHLCPCVAKGFFCLNSRRWKVSFIFLSSSSFLYSLKANRIIDDDRTKYVHNNMDEASARRAGERARRKNGRVGWTERREKQVKTMCAMAECGIVVLSRTRKMAAEWTELCVCAVQLTFWWFRANFNIFWFIWCALWCRPHRFVHSFVRSFRLFLIGLPSSISL